MKGIDSFIKILFFVKKNTSLEHVVNKNCFKCDEACSRTCKDWNFCSQHVLNLYSSGDSILSSYWGLTDSKMRASNTDLQVNLCQKHLFSHRLTHNMTTDCSLIYQFNTWKLQTQNLGRTCCAHKLFFVFVLTFRTIFAHIMFSPCSELGVFNFSCIKLVIQWTICRHIVG